MSVKISASAGYLPKRIVTNDELASIMETSDEWIRSHTGIETRHFAIGENTSDMAAKVAVSLMEKAEVSPEEIDLIIVFDDFSGFDHAVNCSFGSRKDRLRQRILHMIFLPLVPDLFLRCPLQKSLFAAVSTKKQSSSAQKRIPR